VPLIRELLCLVRVVRVVRAMDRRTETSTGVYKHQIIKYLSYKIFLGISRILRHRKPKHPILIRPSIKQNQLASLPVVKTLAAAS
jgi:hypothetical protein